MNEFEIKLAEKRIRISPLHDYIAEYCREFVVEDGEADICVEATAADIAFEREKSAREDELAGIAERHFSDGYLETLAVYRQITEKMLEFDTLLFHGSALAVGGGGCDLDGDLDGGSACDGDLDGGTAVIFTGPSGIGKSTHARLWRENIDDVVMINDDKPLIGIRDGIAFAYGTPWNGKDRLSTNTCAPIGAICILEQARDNHIEEITWEQAFTVLLSQTYRPESAELTQKTLQLLAGFKDAGVRFFRMECNIEPEAAEVCFRGVFG